MQKFCGAPDTKAPLMLVPVDWQEAVTGVSFCGGGGRAGKLTGAQTLYQKRKKLGRFGPLFLEKDRNLT